MKPKSMRLKRVIAGAAALAVAATMLPVAGTAQALPGGTPAAGAVTITPSTGTSATTFSVAVPLAAACPGDNTTGYLYHTFITPLSNDPAPMIYSPSGTPTGPAFTNNLANSIGTRSRNIAPGLGDGLVVTQSNQTFSNALFAGLTPGAYNVGIACTQPDLVPLVQTMRFWSTPVTITASVGAGPNNFTYAVGVAPAAPVITTATAGDTTATVNFTHAASTPATTGYTVTATPTVGAPVVVTGAASPIAIPGLTNGTSYAVTMIATNTVGNSPVSNSVNVTPSLAALPGVTGVTAVPAGPGAITVSWTPPAGPTNPVSYDVTISPVVGTSPVSVPFGTNTTTFTGLTAGTLYSFTVQPIHTPPNSAPASAPVSAAAQAAQVLNQEITVERPVGALILTQRCGVYNALAAETAVDAFPGYPFPLGAETATVNQIGTAPIDDDLAPALDGEFPEYPYPSNPTYPTTCGLNMGTATLITTGALAGQYYAASGRLNEVTVVDTRDIDAGWTVNGTMGTFAIVGDSFDGDYLGWTPRVTSVAGVLNVAATPAQTVTTGSGYIQTVTAGAAVLPGTGLGVPAKAASSRFSAMPRRSA